MATITKRKWKTGKGENREAWVLAYTDQGGKRHKEQFTKKRDADARRVEVEGQVKSGTFRADAATTTVKDACDAYVKYMKARNKRNERVTEHYFKNLEGQLYNYVAPQPDRAISFEGGIGDVKLSQLTAGSVNAFRDRLRDFGVGVVTTRRILGSLSRVLRYAADNDMIATNPAKGVQVIGRRDEGSKKIVPPSKADLATLLAAADADTALKIRFAAAIGLRASEQWALRWAHIDMENGQLTIDSRVDVYGNVDVTKTESGTREVPIAKAIITELQAWKLKSKFSKDDDLVFPNEKGKFIDHHNFVNRSFKRAKEKAIEKAKEDNKPFKPFGWHALRHFAISTWIEAGLQPKTIQTFAGHSTLAVTMSRYGHLFPSDDHAAAMNKIAEAIFTNPTDGA